MSTAKRHPPTANRFPHYTLKPHPIRESQIVQIKRMFLVFIRNPKHVTRNPDSHRERREHRIVLFKS